MGVSIAYLSVAVATRTGRGLQLMSDLHRVGPAIAFLVSGTCMAGSLYFSEVANYEPCRLCWYQRVCMYPIAIVLLVALVRRKRDATPYVLVLATIGMVVSIYHYVVEWYPTLESNVCSLTVPCTTVWFREFGFISLPLMALTGFITVITVLAAPQIAGLKITSESE